MGWQSVSEQVADGIRSRIRDERLAPGHRLGRLADLASEFSVSRPTVREAVRLLEGEHLVEASPGPGGGVFLAGTLPPEFELVELMEARIHIEPPLSARAALRASPGDLELLEQLAIDGRGLDGRLHRLVAEVAGNRVAAAAVHWILDAVQPRLAELADPTTVAEVAGQQRRIVAGIAGGDPEAAETAMRAHLVYLRELA